MNNGRRALVKQYVSALSEYLAGDGEVALHRAYGLGRAAIDKGLGVMELAGAHQEALVAVLLREDGRAESARIAAAEEFFRESLAPFEMMFRGFKEANSKLRDLTTSLERRVAERTRELSDSLDRLKRSIDGTVIAIASAVEQRDPYTAGHQRRVAQLARAIAEDIGLSDAARVEGITVASLLHDVGKISVPSEILNKPGRISESELALIKTHPHVGFEIVKGIDFPWPVAQTILQHHERMDGTGYPAGLPGEDILVEARILAVADVVEAMSSHRPFRPALGVNKAIEEISEHKGVLYDPGAVDACVKLLVANGFDFDAETA